MDSKSAHMVAASKVSMLKPGEFELWRMRIEQHIQMIDYALWEVIENGNTAPKTTVVKGVEKVIPPTTAEEKAQKRLEVKARSTLMMGIPNEHQLKFNSIKDAKLLLEAIEKRFEDVNQKLLRSLSPEWNTHVVVWRNKLELETMSMDDLYNSLKVYEPEVKGTSSSNTSTQNMAFVSSNNSAALMKQLTLLMEFLLLALKLMLARRFLKNTGRKVTINGNKTIGFDKSKVKCYNCHKRGHFSRECRVLRNQDNLNRESSRRSMPVETSTSNALISCDSLGGYDWSD
ncbi:ribonuclease H-like domain-containing protein [Tanacetum coccineum]|uniref:Ribonuclease H-like domain-containing protein n=1 Tax=Tanacetum coccineum TaxID=301880 RepID=A0ABQ5C436_9ASTR